MVFIQWEDNGEVDKQAEWERQIQEAGGLLVDEEQTSRADLEGLGKTANLLAGSGYFDVTSYPYGGCFKRPSVDTLVTVVEGRGQYPDEVRVKFEDGRIGIVRGNALAFQCQRCGDDPLVIPDHSINCQDCGRPVLCADAIHPETYPSTWFICVGCENAPFVPTGAN